ncbi:MAG TPA: dihydrodipicolinate synthase family protein [Flavitalea sp.]|nr:dihydrodipicolinate synthase family protein [Flavitalea sp.]
MEYKILDSKIYDLLHKGCVIPAHPLALDASRQLDESRQRLLTKYYLAAGAGGVAVGVHTTQFEIRRPEYNLFEPVLRMASEEVNKTQFADNIIKVAGITGATANAVEEAETAAHYGYHLGLISMGGLSSLTEDELIKRTKEVAAKIPLFGFYLQPAAGGRLLSYEFWKQFVEIPNVYAIKIAAFNRYQTIDVVRAVCNSPRRDEIALYTGNDDNIIGDLLTPYQFNVQGKKVEKRFTGGLLGHWAVWTSKAVELLALVKGGVNDFETLLTKNIGVTDMNAVIFDAKNSFHGCIPGIHEVLRRQGLLEGTWCLNPDEKMSPGQSEEIDRLYNDYPEMTDDDFVKRFLEKELKHQH